MQIPTTTVVLGLLLPLFSHLSYAQSTYTTEMTTSYVSTNTLYSMNPVGPGGLGPQESGSSTATLLATPVSITLTIGSSTITGIQTAAGITTASTLIPITTSSAGVTTDSTLIPITTSSATVIVAGNSTIGTKVGGGTSTSPASIVIAPTTNGTVNATVTATVSNTLTVSSGTVTSVSGSVTGTGTIVSTSTHTGMAAKMTGGALAAGVVFGGMVKAMLS